MTTARRWEVVWLRSARRRARGVHKRRHRALSRLQMRRRLRVRPPRPNLISGMSLIEGLLVFFSNFSSTFHCGQFTRGPHHNLVPASGVCDPVSFVLPTTNRSQPRKGPSLVRGRLHLLHFQGRVFLTDSVYISRDLQPPISTVPSRAPAPLASAPAMPGPAAATAGSINPPFSVRFRVLD